MSALPLLENLYSQGAGGSLTSGSGCDPQCSAGSQTLRSLGTMTQGKSEQSGLICWSCDSDLPAPLSARQPVLQLITGLSSKMGQMSTPGALPGNRGFLARSRSCLCQAISPPSGRGHLRVSSLLSSLTQDSVGNASGGRSQGALWQSPKTK